MKYLFGLMFVGLLAATAIEPDFAPTAWGILIFTMVSYVASILEDIRNILAQRFVGPASTFEDD